MAIKKQDYLRDSDTTLIKNDFIRDGYHFHSWNSKRDGSGTKYCDQQFVKNGFPDEKTILYAQWGYLLSGYVHDNLGLLYGIGVYYPNEIANFGLLELSAGWEFDRWNDDYPYSQRNILMDKNIEFVLYAKPTIYNITYNENGGTWKYSPSPTTYCITSDTIVLQTDVLTREGYSFESWIDDKGYKIDKIYHGEYGDKILYAQWNNDDTVSYFESISDMYPVNCGSTNIKLINGRYYGIVIGSGGDYLSDLIQDNIYRHSTGGSGCFTSCLFDVYDIIGYQYFDISVGYIQSDTVVTNNSNVNITSKCGTSGHLNSSFEIEKGFGGKGTECIFNGTIKGNDYYIDGFNGDKSTSTENIPYVNAGKYSNQDFQYGGGRSCNGHTYTNYGYVKLERFNEVIFKDEDGTILKEKQYVLSGCDAIPPDNPTKYGYTFSGWDKSYTEIYNDCDIYAQWQPIESTVYFNANGGSEPSITQMEIKYDQPYGTLATTTLDENLFVGWFTDVTGGTKIESTSIVSTIVDQTLYAHWQPMQKIEIKLTHSSGTVTCSTTPSDAYVTNSVGGGSTWLHSANDGDEKVTFTASKSGYISNSKSITIRRKTESSTIPATWLGCTHGTRDEANEHIIRKYRPSGVNAYAQQVGSHFWCMEYSKTVTTVTYSEV